MKAEKNKNKINIALLGSSHGRKIDPMLQENLGTEFDVCSILKPNASLAKVIKDIGKLGKGLTKRDHIIIVGGPENILDRNFHYSIENGLNFIAERTSNTSVGVVGLFKMHDKTWMKGRVRGVNLRLDRALMRHDMAHVGVIDTSSIAREEYTMHDLHLNLQDKKRLVELAAETVVGGHASGISSIPGITHTRVSPF
jgi:hypothetical protein